MLSYTAATSETAASSETASLSDYGIIAIGSPTIGSPMDFITFAVNKAKETFQENIATAVLHIDDMLNDPKKDVVPENVVPDDYNPWEGRYNYVSNLFMSLTKSMVEERIKFLELAAKIATGQDVKGVIETVEGVNNVVAPSSTDDSSRFEQLRLLSETQYLWNKNDKTPEEMALMNKNFQKLEALDAALKSTESVKVNSVVGTSAPFTDDMFKMEQLQLYTVTQFLMNKTDKTPEEEALLKKNLEQIVHLDSVLEREKAVQKLKNNTPSGLQSKL